MFTLRKIAAETTRMGIRTKATLPSLPYAYEALEPIINREIMEIHHTKHHAAYVTNYNAAFENLQNASKADNPTQIIALQAALRFNGGGHINHSIFWNNLSPSGGQPSQEFVKAVDVCFGGMEQMKTQLSAASVGVQGSGWGWLGYNKKTGRLEIASCANQDPLEATQGLVPLFGIDVWEHAYYLQYKNVRADYVKGIFDIANWKDISQRYAVASKK